MRDLRRPFLRNFVILSINRITNKANNGSVQANTLTCSIVADTSTLAEPIMINNGDFIFFAKTIPEQITTEEKLRAFIVLAPSSGSNPINFSSAISEGNSGGQCV